MNSTKLLKSQAPDVTVVVGSGKAAQEFQCYGVILAAASPVFDAMLSSGMKECEQKRIEFPDKDPEEWKAILQCLDTASAFLFDHPQDDDRLFDHITDYPVNCSNVNAFVPWFHELQMTNYLNRCDDIMQSKYHWGQDTIISRQWDRVTHSWVEGEQLDIQQMLELMSFSTRFELSGMQCEVLFVISRLVEKMLMGTGDHKQFTLANICQLVGFLIPMRIRSNNTLEIVDESLQELWNQLRYCLELSVLSIDIVNDVEKMTLLIHHGLHHQHNKMKSDLKRLTSKWIDQEGPFYLKLKREGVGHGGHDHPVRFQGSTLQESDVIDAIDDYFAGLRLHSRSNNCRYEATRGNTIILCFNPKKTLDESLDASETDSDTVDSEQHQIIRSYETDLTVKVGSGDMTKEFACHSAMLSLASTKLDSLINEASGELLLPHFTAEHWSLFYKCISPDNNGALLSEAGTSFDRFERVKYLVPFFKEFDMQNYLNFCIEVMVKVVDSHRFRIDHGNEEEDESIMQILKEMLDVLNFAVDRNFEEVTRRQEENLVQWLQDSRKFGVIGTLDFKTMQRFVSPCLPISRTNPEEPFSSASCPVFWAGMSSSISNHLDVLKRNKYDSSDVELVSSIVQLSFRLRRLES